MGGASPGGEAAVDTESIILDMYFVYEDMLSLPVLTRVSFEFDSKRQWTNKNSANSRIQNNELKVCELTVESNTTLSQ